MEQEIRERQGKIEWNSVSELRDSKEKWITFGL